MADRGHRTTLCLRWGVIPRRTMCRWADPTAVIWLRPNGKPLQRDLGVRLRAAAAPLDTPSLRLSEMPRLDREDRSRWLTSG
jgi:hypothetical protein